MQNAADMARDRQFNMRLSEAEAHRLDVVAAHYGLNAANLLRMLEKKEADALGIAPAPAPPPKPAKKSPKK